MPIRLLVGPNGSGKTTRIVKSFKQSPPSRHRSSVRLIVPSVSRAIEIRKLILSDPEFPGILGDPICTFTRLAREILDGADADTPRLISDTERSAILREVVQSSPADYFVEVQRSTRISHELGRIIGVLKRSGVGPGDLGDAVHSTDTYLPEHSRRKLTGLAELYGAYAERLSASGLAEPSDLVQSALEVLTASPGMLRRLDCVMLDGFERFTPDERRLVDLMAEQCGEVIIAMEEDEPFLARLPGVTIEYLEAGRKSSSLSHLKCRPFRAGSSEAVPDDSVRAVVTADPRMQAEWVAREMRRLVREQGFRYSEIAVVTRSLRDHRKTADVLREYRIPLAHEMLRLSGSAPAQHLLNGLDDAVARSTDIRIPLQHLLDEIALPDGEDELRAHYAALKAVRRVMDGVSRSEDIAGTLSPAEFADLLRAGIASGVYRLPGEVTDGVPLLTAGSVGGRKFRVVFILDLMEGTFPRLPREDAFVNDWEREILNPHLPSPLPTDSDSVLDEQRLFRRAVSSVEDRLYLCCPTEAPSPFLDDVDALFVGGIPRTVYGPGDVIPPIAEVEIVRELSARTVLDCCTSVDPDTLDIAASSYNLLLDAGIVGAETFDWLGQEYPEPPEQTPGSGEDEPEE